MAQKQKIMRLLPAAWQRRLASRYAVHVDERFEDLASFIAFLAAHPRFSDSGYVQRLAEHACRFGAAEPLTNSLIQPGALSAAEFLREGLFYDGLNSRMRAVLLVMASLIEQEKMLDAAIYAPEAVTPLAWRLRRRFLRFIGSEYVTDEQKASALYPIPVLDLEDLQLRDDAFDLVVANEVLEHVSSLDRALSEIHRVLKPGGWHVGTVPLLYLQHESLVRARLENGRVNHLMQPEYHVNPIDTEHGALVFEIPGWNILQRARATGFRHAAIRYVLSTDHAIMGDHIGGVLVLEFQK